MMPDDLSRAIGRLEGGQAALLTRLARLEGKVDSIHGEVTTKRIKVAGLAGSVAAAVSGLGFLAGRLF